MPSTVDDAPALLQAQISAFHHDSVLYPGVEPGGPPGYDSLAVLEADIAAYPVFTIRADGLIIGGVVIFDRGAGHFHLDRIYIAPEYHNRGIGSQAIAFIERSFPAQKWSLHTPSYAVRNQHFYENFGYIKRGTDYDGDLELIYYEKIT